MGASLASKSLLRTYREQMMHIPVTLCGAGIAAVNHSAWSLVRVPNRPVYHLDFTWHVPDGKHTGSGVARAAFLPECLNKGCFSFAELFGQEGRLCPFN